MQYSHATSILRFCFILSAAAILLHMFCSDFYCVFTRNEVRSKCDAIIGWRIYAVCHSIINYKHLFKCLRGNVSGMESAKLTIFAITQPNLITNRRRKLLIDRLMNWFEMCAYVIKSAMIPWFLFHLIGSYWILAKKINQYFAHSTKCFEGIKNIMGSARMTPKRKDYTIFKWNPLARLDHRSFEAACA